MTTTPVSAENDSPAGDEISNSSAYDAALARFDAVRTSMAERDASLLEVTSAQHEYDLPDGYVVPAEDPLGDDVPTETDFHDPESSLVPSLFADSEAAEPVFEPARSDVPDPYVNTSVALPPFADPVPYDEPVTKPEPLPEPTTEQVERLRSAPKPESYILGVTDPAPIDVPVVEEEPVTSEDLDTEIRRTAYSALRDDQDLTDQQHDVLEEAGVPLPPTSVVVVPAVPVFEPEPTAIEDDSPDAHRFTPVQDDYIAIAQDVIDSRPGDENKTSRVPSLSDGERQRLRDAPAPPPYQFRPEAGPSPFDAPVAIEAPSLVAPVLSPATVSPFISDEQDDDSDHQPRRAGVASLLADDQEAPVSPDADRENFAKSLFESAEPVEEATVAVDAKKRFARAPKPPKTKTDKPGKEPKAKKDKPFKEPKPVKDKAPRSAPKTRRHATPVDDTEDQGDKTGTPKVKSRKRTALLAGAIALFVVFVSLAALVGAKAAGYEPSNVSTNAVAPALPVTALVMAKAAPVNDFSKGDLVVVTRPDDSKVYGIFYSKGADKAIKMYDNEVLKPRDVGYKSLGQPKVTVPSVGTEVTTALNSPGPAGLAGLALLGSVALLMVRKNA
jgi:hypothetical protein